MRERVFSLETEYAISFQPAGGSACPEASEIVEALRKPLGAKYGSPSSTFLINGGKLHHDQGHAEFSLPECRSARQAALYDRAEDHMLGSLVPEAEGELDRSGYRGRLFVVKNNVDPEGHTYGCHENYSAERTTCWLGREDHLYLTARYLIPFLVSRQVICGSGRAGLGPSLAGGVAFQIMQRADFISETVSKETQSRRPIVNIGRENEPLASERYRRLHLILADANMSGWATFLKLGTTGILLRMLEDICIGEIPHLTDPVKALKQISRDPSCRIRVPLRNGQKKSAVEIQRIYLDQAKDYFRVHEASPEEQEIVGLWEDALEKLQEDPGQLFGRADWVTKKQLMERYLERAGLNWNAVTRKGPAHFDLLKMDIQYHDLSQGEGLFNRLLQGRLDSFLGDEEIRRAQTEPPPYTRAKLRGDAVALARDAHLRCGTSWQEIAIDRRSIRVDEPLDFFQPEFAAILRDGSGNGGVGGRSSAADRTRSPG